MKKLVVLFFVCLYVLAATEFKELLKLPILIEHYSEHQSENKSITFFEFLKIHYLGDNNSDDFRDERLPFKSQGHSFGFQIFAEVPTFHTEITYYPDFTQKTFTGYKNQFILSQSPNSVWQPPKNA